MNELLVFAGLTLVKAAPLIFAALAGVVCERSGILNIALEGQLAVGAFCGVAVSSISGNALAGVAAGVLCAALFGGILGLAATRFNVDQIVAGTGLNLIALAGAGFGLVLVFNQPGASSEVPALGDAGERALIVLALACAALLHLALYKTPWGLRIRACGENPWAAASANVDVRRVRLGACLLGGALTGLGGAYLSLGELDLYSDGMTAGRGFIALAAVIFGRWSPLGATAAALVFGALSALQFVLQRSGIPSELMQALPYLAALAALGGLTGRARAPQAEGKPYAPQAR